MYQAVSGRSLTAGAPAFPSSLHVEIVFYELALGQDSFFSSPFFLPNT